MFSPGFVRSLFFRQLLKEASNQGRRSVSATMEILYKAAQDFDFTRIMRDLEFQISEIIKSRFLTEDEKKHQLEKLVRDNLQTISRLVFGVAPKNTQYEEIRGDQSFYILDPNTSEKFILWCVEKLLNNETLEQVLIHHLNTGLQRAKKEVEWRRLKELEFARGEKGEIFEPEDATSLEAYDTILDGVSSKAEDEKKEDKLSASNKLQELKNLFENTLNDTFVDPDYGPIQRDIFSFFSEQDLLPKWKAFVEEIDKMPDNTPQEEADLYNRIDEFYNSVSSFMEKKLVGKKRNTSTNMYQEYNTADMETMVHEYINRVGGIDKLVDYMLSGDVYHKLPIWISSNNTAHPMAVRMILRAAIRAALILNTKSSFGVSVSSPQQNQSLKKSDLFEHILKKEIKKLHDRPTDLIKIIEIIQNSIYPPTSSNPSDDLTRKTDEHMNGLLLGGLIVDAKKKLGEKFASLSLEGKMKLVDEFYDIIYPYFPHYYYKDPRNLKQRTTKKFNELIAEYGTRENAIAVLKNWILNRINTAIDLDAGKTSLKSTFLKPNIHDIENRPQLPGSFTPMETQPKPQRQKKTIKPQESQEPLQLNEPLDLNVSLWEQISGEKHSQLQILIKKYAQKTPQPVLNEIDKNAEEDLAQALMSASYGDLSEKLKETTEDSLGSQANRVSKVVQIKQEESYQIPRFKLRGHLMKGSMTLHKLIEKYAENKI